MYVPWELNPQPFVLLTQCSTTEPQDTYKSNVNLVLLELVWDGDTFKCSEICNSEILMK